MREGEITNKIRGGKVIFPSIIAARKVWGKGRKYVGYQKSDPLIQTTMPEGLTKITWTAPNG
jgi:hypothetical protein